MNTKELDVKISPGQLPLSFDWFLEGGGEGVLWGALNTPGGPQLSRILKKFKFKISETIKNTIGVEISSLTIRRDRVV
jgi:hypothetical protein